MDPVYPYILLQNFTPNSNTQIYHGEKSLIWVTILPTFVIIAHSKQTCFAHHFLPCFNCKYEKVEYFCFVFISIKAGKRTLTKLLDRSASFPPPSKSPRVFPTALICGSLMVFHVFPPLYSLMA